VAGFCKKCNESLDSIKDGKFLQQLSKCYLLFEELCCIDFTGYLCVFSDGRNISIFTNSSFKRESVLEQQNLLYKR
jgi:hypothetical protein